MQLATSRTLTATQGLVFLKTCIDCCIYSFSNYADSCGVENVVILIGLYLQLIKVFTNFVSRALNTNLALFSNDNPLCLWKPFKSDQEEGIFCKQTFRLQHVSQIEKTLLVGWECFQHHLAMGLPKTLPQANAVSHWVIVSRSLEELSVLVETGRWS